MTQWARQAIAGVLMCGVFAWSTAMEPSKSTIRTLTLTTEAPAEGLPAPTGLQLDSIDRIGRQVRMSWKVPSTATGASVAGVVGYRVDLGMAPGVYTSTYPATGPTLTVQGLVGNQRYYAVVRAVDAAGHWSPASVELSFGIIHE